MISPLGSLELNLNGDNFSYFSREYFEENYIERCYLQEIIPALKEFKELIVFNGNNHFTYNTLEGAWILWKNNSLSLFIDDIEIPFVQEIDIRGIKMENKSLTVWLKEASPLSSELLFFSRNKDISLTLNYYEEMEKELLFNTNPPDAAELDSEKISYLLYKGFDFLTWDYSESREFYYQGLHLSEPLTESSLKLLSRKNLPLKEFSSETPVYMNIREFTGILPFIAGISLYGNLNRSEELKEVLLYLRDGILSGKIIPAENKDLLSLLKGGEYIIADSRLLKELPLDMDIYEYELPSFRGEKLPSLLFTRGLTVTSAENRDVLTELMTYLRLPSVRERLEEQGVYTWNSLSGFYLPVSRDSWMFKEVMDSAFRLLLTDIFPEEQVLTEAQKAFHKMKVVPKEPGSPL